MNAKLIEPEESQYKDLLNEIYPEIKLGYLTFSPADIIEELDPTAFRCGYNDYCDEYSEWQCEECETMHETEEEAEECCKEEEEETEEEENQNEVF